MIRKKMMDEVKGDLPTHEYALAAYRLQEEIGLSHQDIFGERNLIPVRDEVERDSFISNLLFGPRTVYRHKQYRGLGMKAQTFKTYLRLMKEVYEKREKEKEKQKMRSKIKSKTMG